MSAGEDWKTTFRPDIPSPARMYNYFPGGKDNYPADRQAAEKVIAASPEVLLFARQNRSLLDATSYESFAVVLSPRSTFGCRRIGASPLGSVSADARSSRSSASTGTFHR